MKEQKSDQRKELVHWRKGFPIKGVFEKCVWQDEKDFTLEVRLNHQNSRVYGKNRKGDLMIDYFITPIGNLKKGWYQPASRGTVPQSRFA